MDMPSNCRKPSKEEKKMRLLDVDFDNGSETSDDITAVNGEVVHSECFDTEPRTYDEYIKY